MSSQMCRVCKCIDNNLSSIFSREMFLGSKEVFEYIFCASCGSLSIKTIPSNIADYYENYYSLGLENNYSDSRIRNFVKKCLVKFPIESLGHKICCKLLSTQNDFRLKSFIKCNIKKNDAILDIGCGSGDFLKELNFLGYRNLIGIDAFLEKDIVTSEKI